MKHETSGMSIRYKNTLYVGEEVYAPDGTGFIIKMIEKYPGEEAVLYGDKIVMFAYRCSKTPKRFGEQK